MRLHHASNEDTEHLGSVLNRVSRRFGTRVDLAADGMLHLHTGRR